MHERIPFHQDAIIISGGIMYSVVIQNISLKGLNLSAYKKIHFSPNEIVEIKFKTSPQKTITLNCRVKWFTANNGSPDFPFSSGLEVIYPSSLYTNFVHSLYKSTVTSIG